MSLNQMLMGYIPVFIQNALAGLNDPQVTAEQNSVYSSGPQGRMVGKRRRMTCRPQYRGKLNAPGHFDK